MDNISLKDLYKLFFGKKLVDLTRIETNTKQLPSSKQVTLTPVSKSIYDTTSPKSKPYILAAMMKNTDVIDAQMDIEEQLDPDYQEKMENNGLGFFMEDFVSVYCHCPVCGQSLLKKYSHSNVPVVDLVCINTAYHKNKCFLFQVKISLTNDYFNLKTKKIIVGSKTYGEPAHHRKGTDSMNQKIVVPGYICIKLYRDKQEPQNYVIDHRNSFVLVPNYQNNSNKYYYHYLDEVGMYGKNMITWDETMVDTFPLNKITNISKIAYEVFLEKEIPNPYMFLIGDTNVARKIIF